jgi:hypothetical protein
MPGFNLGGAINSAASWVGGAPITRGIFGNPLYTALLITALAAVVLTALYHLPVKQGGKKRAARALLYVFFLVSGVQFVHHYVVTRAAQSNAESQGVRDVFAGIELSRGLGAPGAVPVYPMGEEPAQVGAAVRGGWGAANPEAAGGSCPLGGPGAPPQGGAGRPDNLPAGPLDIRDVVVPTTAAPFRARRS